MNDKLTYYYMLEGADKDWIRSERNEFVSYSQLPPGQYTFKVYCENSEGIKSPMVTTFPFHITPPFYRTAWFIMLLVAFVGSLIYLIHRLRVNRLIAVQKLRLRVARDLHDDMGSTLSTINILSSMAKSKINTDTPKATEFITKISDNSQRMMEAMDDIVWSIKPSNDSMEKITARMREFATNVLEAKDIEIDFKVAPKVNDIRLNMEARRDFFLVFKEAVNNAAKYSKASLVHVFITVHNKKLLLMVHDNGIGFEVNDNSRGNGMGNMQKRADAMKGRLLVKSAPGEGTKITLTVPLT
jgi:signal transduction histidine kinase